MTGAVQLAQIDNGAHGDAARGGGHGCLAVSQRQVSGEHVAVQRHCINRDNDLTDAVFLGCFEHVDACGHQHVDRVAVIAFGKVNEVKKNGR